MTVAFFVFDKSVYLDFAGGVAHICHAAEQHQAVGQIGAALKGQVVDGSGGHGEPGVTAGAGACHFIDPGHQLAAEQPSRGVDILISDHVDVFHL